MFKKSTLNILSKKKDCRITNIYFYLEENSKLQNTISEFQQKLNKIFLINQEKEEKLTKIQDEKENLRLQ